MKSLQQFLKQVDILRDVEAQRRERKKKNKRLGIFSTAVEACGENEQVVQLLLFPSSSSMEAGLVL